MQSDSEPKVMYRPGNPPPYTSGPHPGHYGPQPGPYGPPPGPTVIQAHVVPRVVPVVVGRQMGSTPATMACPSCNATIITRVEIKASTKTHLFAALLCILGCWPCVCVPYCMESCNNADHYCPNCSSYIGSYMN